MIYLDSAATSFYRPPQVAQAVVEAMNAFGNSSRGTYGVALSGARCIFETRRLFSELFDADGPEQVAFTANSTESLNMAIKGVLQPGDRAVTTVLEHNSVLRPLYEMERLGVKLQVIGCEKETGGENNRLGKLDDKALEQAIQPGIKAVIVTHASNLTGNLTDIRRIGKKCREAGALFIVDASQTAGIFPISMKEDFIDILCFTGHKGLLGPHGTGGICLRKGIYLHPLLSGGSGIQTFSKTHPMEMPTHLEAGTLNSHGIAGLHAALLYLRETGLSEIRKREQELARAFYEKTSSIKNIRFYGDYEAEERAAIVALNLGDEDSGAVSDYLAQEWEIATRSGGHCAPLMHRTFGTEEQGIVRFSFSHFNTMEQVETALQALKEY